MLQPGDTSREALIARTAEISRLIPPDSDLTRSAPEELDAGPVVKVFDEKVVIDKIQFRLAWSLIIFLAIKNWKKIKMTFHLDYPIFSNAIAGVPDKLWKKFELLLKALLQTQVSSYVSTFLRTGKYR